MWASYKGVSLILEKLLSRSSFYDIACFSILIIGPHMDAIITSDNVFRSSSIDVIIFNCGPLIIDASLLLEDSFVKSRITAII